MISNMNRSEKLEVVILVISLSIAFSSEIGKIEIANNITYSILAIWIIWALIRFAINNFYIKNRFIGETLKTFIKYNFYPKIIIYVYTLILIIFGLTEKRFFSTNIQTFINAISAISILYLYKNKAFIYSIAALFLSYIYAFFGSVLIYGIRFYEHLEFHDMAFAAGYIIIYVLLIKKKIYKKDLKFILISVIITILAFKRIEIAALILVFAYFIFLKMLPIKWKKRLIEITGISFILICYLFIYIVTDGGIWEFMSSFGIEVSGRNYYYQAAVELSKFNITFFGLGRNSMATLFTTNYSYMNVGNVHSDILRMYIECGFALFGFWLWLYLYKMPKVIYEKFGYEAMQCIFLCTLYTFIVYFTDNTELYLVNQYFYMLIPIHYIFISNKEKINIKV